ncbi:polysaccharide pyruvyl transferase family protein [Paenibacillus qinlingensis]|uniref:Polysaccharide pyruvyl transferase WcaK-like protein n=1 Tax=Paenibacillus qinlingensis TaxID=1837343 RepID=A0ABU1NS38_9BACL|nr:polysaccharide pyruvyl transferase family protein [Paenibacillus qinlingensis]MDR6550265.1 polysaccharide pyruvyl transferase WcaK-like protein [Paenibacillus qinlingensis]
MKRILYLGWIGFNNIGDELMWQLFRELSWKYLSSKTYDVIPSIPGVDIRNHGPYDTIVLGGGSLLIPGYIDVVHQAIQKNKQVIIWGSGHDRPEYTPLDESGQTSLHLAYTGEHKPTSAKLAEVVRQSAFCGVRGPLSQQFLQHSGVAMEKTMISGDPAFLLPSPVRKKREGSKRVIGVNWGTAYNRIFGGSEEKVEKHLVEALRRLIWQGYDITIFPVWGPDREACERLYRKLGDTEHVKLDQRLHHYEDLIDIMQAYDLTINFKLHSNYLSAAAGVPFICLGYRFKSLDFGYSINLPEYILPTHHDQLMDAILDRVAKIEVNQGYITEQYEVNRNSFQTLLELPFKEKLF